MNKVFEGRIEFITVEEGYLVLKDEYFASEVTGGQMIDTMIEEGAFDSSIPIPILYEAIQEFREWDCSMEDDEVFADGADYVFMDGTPVPDGIRVGIFEEGIATLDLNISVAKDNTNE